MANLTRFLTYYIVLTDPALVAQYQAQYPYGYQFAPYNPLDSITHQPGGAAVAFQAPWAGSYPGTDPNPGTYHGPAPYTWSPEWISANNYDQSVASFQRHSGGFWGMGGTSVTYIWIGQFTLAEPAVPTVAHVVPPAPANIPKRHFIQGFEFGGGDALLAVNDSGLHYSRDAARHVGGFGLAFRGPSNCRTTVQQDKFGAALTPRTWERFYLRLRKADPATTVTFWQTGGSVSANAGVALGVAPDGRLACFNQDAAGNLTLLASSPEALPAWNGRSDSDCWKKIDVLVRYNPNENPGAGGQVIVTGGVRVFVNGVEVITQLNIPAGSGLGGAQNHRQTSLGTDQVGTSLYLDMDDWIACDWPGPTPYEQPLAPALTNPDWLQGTKIVATRPKQFGAAHANWTGDVRFTMQNPLGTSGFNSGLTSTTAGAIAETDLDVDLAVPRDPGMKGVLAFAVHALINSNTNGTFGYILNAGAAVMAAIAQGGAIAGFSAFKTLADGTVSTYPVFTTLSVRHVKAADANASTVLMMGAQVEMVGMWGLADYRLTENGASGTPTFPRFVGQHNAPYPRSIYGNGAAAPPPNSPVVVTSGVYVGNSTGQDLTFRTPIHFLFIRPVTGDAGGVKWWSAMELAHKNTEESGRAFLARVDQDTTFVPGVGVDLQQERYRIRIAGADTQINAVGVSYHYIAFSDPGARFLLCGTFSAFGTQASFDNPLINATFTPEAAFVFPETLGSSAAASLLFKGLGTTVDALMRFTTTAQLAAAMTFAAGKLTTQAALHALSSGIAFPFALFRRHDGSNDPGEPAVMALLNWTGDGTASRTISIAPASGKRPIFAFVCASDAGGGFFRDASHLTTHSCKEAGADSTTGITGGGIDSLSVGASLNANGVTYSAFVLIGDATAGNGGFGVDAEYIPVEAGPPQDGPFPTPIIAPPIVPPIVPLIGEPDLDTSIILSDLGTSIGGLVGGQACEFYTRHVVNMALTRIGVSARVANIATEVTQAAITARAHILEDVNQVLRDFDWPFATRYANLVLVAGTVTVPAEADWQYSYRAPNSMMKARRLVGQADQRRTYDPNPPKFRLGSDSVGPLVYTNEVATAAMPLTLEYTVRQLCPALYGDSLFRDALAWKFAFSMAPVLSKDTKKQEYCRQMYERAIGLAKVPAAQEQQQPPTGQADWINDREAGPGGTRDPWDR